MGLIRRFFGGPSAAPVQISIEEAHAEAAERGDKLVELNIVGEAAYQGALARLAGPKDADGKHAAFGVTLRCEPANAYDRNAVRVEVMGQLLAYVARAQAALLCPRIAAACNGVIEARGMIVGGWNDGASEGHYGIRVWLTTRDTDRLGVVAADIDKSLRPHLDLPTMPPVATGERRLSPQRAPAYTSQFGDEQVAYGSGVTVVGEEHYQATILAAIPSGWDTRACPLLVDLDVVADGNPHTKRATPCVGVRIGSERVGYFTSAMTERYRNVIESALAEGARATAVASAYQGTKGGTTFWRLKVDLSPADWTP